MKDITTLTKAFDHAKIKPGIYASASDTKAWPILTGMELIGTAVRTREWFEEANRQCATFLVGRPVRDNVRMPQSARNYETPLKHYNYWQEAWWREAIQNGVDAKATAIDCSAMKHGDGTWTIGCADNGTGMSEKILLHAFLTLGGTGKTEEDQGGFGKAKELLVWPWLRWAIHSRDLLAVGKNDNFSVYRSVGGEWVWKKLVGEPFYETGDRPEFEPPPDIVAEERTGTLLQVVMPEERHVTVTPCAVYIEKCWTPNTEFRLRSNSPEPLDLTMRGELENGPTVRGGIVEGYQNVPVRGSVPPKFERKWVTLAKIHYAKVETTKPRVLVRTDRGLFMYEEELETSEKLDGYIIVELIGDPKQLLTDSRDSLSSYEIRAALSRVRDKIGSEGRRAVKPHKTYEETTIYEGAKQRAGLETTAEAELRAAVNQVMSSSGPIKKEDEIPAEAKKIAGDVLEEEYKRAQAEAPPASINTAATRDVGEVHMMQRIIGSDAREAMAKQLVWKPAFILHNEEGSFRIPSKFRPDRMTPAILRLLKVWTETCRNVLIQLGYSREWGTGFLFSGEAEAMYMSEAGQDWLLLNPFREPSGDAIMNPSLESDRNLIYALAVHEATHMVDNCHSHDIAFAIAFTKNTALTLHGARAIKKLVSAIPLRGQEEFKGQSEASSIASKAARSLPPDWNAKAATIAIRDLGSDTRALVFNDDSVLYWYDRVGLNDVGKAERHLGVGIIGKRTASAHLWDENDLRIKMPQAVASPAVVMTVARMFAVDADRTRIYASDQYGEPVFDGKLRGLEDVLEREAPSTGKTDVIAKLRSGGQIYVDAQVTANGDGIMTVDKAGLAHVIWMHEAEGKWDYPAAREYADAHGLFDYNQGIGSFTVTSDSYDFAIIGDRQVSPPSGPIKHDYKQMVEWLKFSKRSAHWIRGFLKVLLRQPSPEATVYVAVMGIVVVASHDDLRLAVAAALGDNSNG